MVPPDGGEADTGPSDDASVVEVPPLFSEAAGVYDATANRVVVFGANVGVTQNCIPMTEISTEMWTFSLETDRWSRLSTSGGPGERARYAVAADGADLVYLFGGRTPAGFGSYENHADVWTFNLRDHSWAAFETTGELPQPKSTTVVAYDAVRQQLIVHGGNVSEDGLTLTGTAEMHILDLETGAFRAVTADPSPPARLYHSGVVMGDKFYVFGGTEGFNPPYLNDVWAFDLVSETWTELAANGDANGPLPRFGAEVFADAAHDRLVIFGGHDQADLGNRNDVWGFDLTNESWVSLRPGDVLFNPDVAQCDFPPDFTTPEEGSPERRYSFVRAQTDTHALILGGKTDCGSINDAWSFDFEAGTWDVMSIATQGEACNRTGRVGCSTLCF